jgi:hypothetical protein
LAITDALKPVVQDSHLQQNAQHEECRGNRQANEVTDVAEQGVHGRAMFLIFRLQNTQSRGYAHGLSDF